MEDQGVILGAALGDEDFGHGIGIQTVGTQTVNGLRGDGHQSAGADDPGCQGWGGRVGGGENFRFHVTSFFGIGSGAGE